MRRNLFTELIPLYSNHKFIQNERAAKKYLMAEKALELSHKEKLIKICNQSLNKKWKDGRIYHLDKDGKYSSHSVSPYSRHFEFNIEDNIKDLVLALKSKNYLSISSCEGHGLYFRRYVTIIFPSKETAEDFKLSLPFKLTYKLQHATKVLNNSLEVDSYGNITSIIKDETKVQNKEQSIEYINFFTKRFYADAWLLDIIISEGLQPYQSFLYYLKNIKTIIFKKFCMNRFTKKIKNYILSDKMPANIY